ncbi:MAG: hypothetical protein NVS1B11_21370 [Terriglobales bacterium]
MPTHQKHTTERTPGNRAEESANRVLFVDDEVSIRLTMPPILEHHGFEVRSAASVPEALVEINNHHFDVLISDLNIGEEGDGFQVVSAMRHVQPKCVNLILTGYPAFDNALQAIHSQVDDYLVKPAELELLLRTIHERLAARKHVVAPKSLVAMLKENSAQIVERAANHRDSKETSEKGLSRKRLGDLTRIFNQAIIGLEARDDVSQKERSSLAADYGRKAKQQGHSISAVLEDFQALQQCSYDVLETKLSELDLRRIVSALSQLQKVLHEMMAKAVEAYTS